MLEGAPLLSIGIPTFNRADFLTRCLESITAQIDKEMAEIVEVIISNNASTDDTEDVALAFCQRHGYVSYFRNATNLGAEKNVFAAAEKAKGEYLWIFGDDDLMLDGALKRILPILKEGKFPFIMTNKMVKNRDLSETIIENQNQGYDDTVFSSISDLCAEFGFFTNLGFISTAVFSRQDFMAVDPTPYLDIKLEYPQNGVFLEAFHNKPCLYIADMLVCQRQFTNVEVPIFWNYISSVGLTRMVKVLKSKGVIDYRFLERINEKMLLKETRKVTDYVLDTLSAMSRGQYVIPQADWADILEVFSAFENAATKRKVLAIYAEYLSRSMIELITQTPRELLADRLLDAGEKTPQEWQVATIGDWVKSDDRVAQLTQVWAKISRTRGKLAGQKSAIAEDIFAVLELAARNEQVASEWANNLKDVRTRVERMKAELALQDVNINDVLAIMEMVDEHEKMASEWSAILREYWARLERVKARMGEERNVAVGGVLSALEATARRARSPLQIQLAVTRAAWRTTGMLLSVMRRVTPPGMRRAVWRIYARLRRSGKPDQSSSTSSGR
ncbi:MAG: glycosyltransferase family 2 protein [Chloroflexi bacterium]|nr:glycosyltransferase family 2 protein [Chloroflexota bacterium]